MTATTLKPRKRIANSEEITRRRFDLGMSGAAFARLAGISDSYLSRLESGDTKGSPGALKKIADAFGCKVSDITMPEPRHDSG